MKVKGTIYALAIMALMVVGVLASSSVAHADSHNGYKGDNDPSAFYADVSSALDLGDSGATSARALARAEGFAETICTKRRDDVSDRVLVAALDDPSSPPVMSASDARWVVGSAEYHYCPKFYHGSDA